MVGRDESIPCKPDLIIAETLASGKVKVCIIDIQIAWEDRMDAAAQGKIIKYEPRLCHHPSPTTWPVLV
jgi:hypothetical protein